MVSKIFKSIVPLILLFYLQGCSLNIKNSNTESVIGKNTAQKNSNQMNAKNFEHSHFIHLPHPGGRLCTEDILHTHKYRTIRHQHRIHGGCFNSKSKYTQREHTKNVVLLQIKLRELGFYNRKPDGKDTPEFRSALEKVPREVWSDLWLRGD